MTIIKQILTAAMTITALVHCEAKGESDKCRSLLAEKEQYDDCRQRARANYNRCIARGQMSACHMDACYDPSPAILENGCYSSDVGASATEQQQLTPEQAEMVRNLIISIFE
jgi:hypothetical protein